MLRAPKKLLTSFGSFTVSAVAQIPPKLNKLAAAAAKVPQFVM